MQLQFIPFKYRLLVIEYSYSSVAATLYSSEWSLQLRCCSKPSSQLPGRFSAVSKWCHLRRGLSLGNKTNSHEAKSGLYGGWGSIVILFWAKNSHISDKFFGTSSTQIFLMCVSSAMIRWASVFGSPTSSAINRTFKRRSLPRTAFTWVALFSVLAAEGRPARCSSSTLSLPSLKALCHLNTKQRPHKLSSTSATFRNQTFRVSRRIQLRNAVPHCSAFSPWQDTKTTTHFANVPTATKVRTQLRKSDVWLTVHRNSVWIRKTN